jgi:hypothetical protein
VFKNRILFWPSFSLIGLGLATSLLPGASTPGRGPNYVRVVSTERFALVTYVLNPEQENKAEALVKSLRRFGGAYAGAPVYVVLGNPQSLPCARLRQAGVDLVATDADELGRGYPLAIKAFAAAQIERLVADRVETLAWFDPETLVLGPLQALDLGGGYDAALRPVFKVNNVGQPPGTPPDAFWKPIYDATGLNPATVPAVRTIVEGQPVKAYFNCEIFSVRPRAGIFRKWAACLKPFLKDREYQRTACPDSLHRLFLHQSVLSAVIVSNTDASRRRALPDSCGYPLNLHQNLPPERKVAAWNDLSAVILENLWDDRPDWIEIIEVREPLASWLRQAFADYRKAL